MTSSTASTYREKLTAPAWLWLAGLVAALSLGVAYAAPFTALIGLAVFGITMAVIGVALLRSAPVVEVRTEAFHAGAAHLPLRCVGTVTPLDAAAAARLRGADADPFAWMVLRGWIPTAIRIDVDDPDDDTPYWYVSTRHPQELAQALTAQRQAERDRPAGAPGSDTSG